jgi:hypothetical protein
VFEENRRIRNENLAELLATWSDADRRALRELLGRFATDLENFEKTRPAPAGARTHTDSVPVRS